MRLPILTEIEYFKSDARLLDSDYRKSSKETRGSYSSFEAQNAGLLRNWFILPTEFQVYCGSY